MDGDRGVAAIELAAALGDKKIVLISQPYRLHSQNDGISPDLKNMPPACFCGDPYGNRTHVTAVKGRCLNRLTNGPGSGDLT